MHLPAAKKGKRLLPSKNMFMDGIPNKTGSTDGIMVLARTKLSERPIVWKEAYTKRALFLKKQFHEVLGPGSYFRFEGHDTETDDDYFVVVSPAGIHSPESSFFSGVRKLPADYAAGGLYFHDIKEAMDYAVATWGVAAPGEMRYYDSDDLKGIDQKIKEWKKEQGQEEKSEEYLEEWFDSIKEGEEDVMTVKPVSQEYFYAQSDTFPFFVKIAMPSWLRNESGFTWWDINDVLNGADESYEEAARAQPSLRKAKPFAIREIDKRKRQIEDKYGPEYVGSNFYKAYLVHRPDRGTYLIAVSPYLGTSFQQAMDKFGVFRWKLNLASNEEIHGKVMELLHEYAERFNVQLTEDDIVVQDSANPMIALSDEARQKVYNSPEWKSKILDHYGIQPGRGMVKKLRDEYRDRKSIYDRLKKEHNVRLQTGQAFEDMMPPPPEVGLSKRYVGQQTPNTINRQSVENDGNLTELEEIEKYGFDSIKEAIEHCLATEMPGAPISEIPDTTSEDLRQARIQRQKDIVEGRVQPSKKRAKTPAEQSAKEEIGELAEEPVQAITPVEPAKEMVVAEASSVDGMRKMASELAEMGKNAEAEGIHKILRNHMSVEKKAEGDWPEHLKEGRFTTYCKKNGFAGPCKACAEKAMKSDDASVRGMASFYMNTVKP